MDTQAILKKIEDLIGPVIGNLGYALIERELVMDGGRWVLRLYIDKESGITVGDCERVSNGIGDLIEVEGVVPMNYTLEVSSPGLDRPLRRREDFERFCGSVIRLRTSQPIAGRSNYKGVLIAMDGDDIVMSIDGAEHRIPLAALLRARLELGEDVFKRKSVN